MLKPNITSRTRSLCYDDFILNAMLDLFLLRWYGWGPPKWRRLGLWNGEEWYYTMDTSVLLRDSRNIILARFKELEHQQLRYGMWRVAPKEIEVGCVVVFPFLFFSFLFFPLFGHPLTLIKPSQPLKHGKLGELFCLKWPCSQGFPYNFSQLCCKDEYPHSCSES